MSRYVCLAVLVACGGQIERGPELASLEAPAADRAPEEPTRAASAPAAEPTTPPREREYLIVRETEMTAGPSRVVSLCELAEDRLLSGWCRWENPPASPYSAPVRLSAVPHAGWECSGQGRGSVSAFAVCERP